MTACDAGGPDPLTAAVLAAGIPIDWRHDAATRARSADGTAVVDRLAVTKAITSVQPDHPELVAARDARDRARERPAGRRRRGGDRWAAPHRRDRHARQVHDLGLAAAPLAAAGRDPSGFVGRACCRPRSPGRSGAWPGSDAAPDFVVEADEYAGNFDPYRPDIAVLVSAEWDHPDVFADEDDVVAAFVELDRPHAARPEAASPTLVANVGDPGVRRVVDALDGLGRASASLVRLASPDGDRGRRLDDRSAAMLVGRIARERTVDGTELEIAGLRGADAAPDRVRLRLIGRHMAIDGLMAAGGALAAGVDADDILRGARLVRGRRAVGSSSRARSAA